MRVHSRELFVGFLLVLGVVVAACQPVQPVSEVVEVPTSEAIGESLPITDTATLSEMLSVSDSTVLSVTEGAANTTTVTAAEVTTMTSAITATVPVTETIEVSRTGASVPLGPIATGDPAALAAGLAAYRAQYCGVCHMLDAAETRGTFGPPHNGMSATAALYLADPNYHGKATTPADYIYESIVDPQVFTVPGYATTSHRMPSYSFLDDETLNALVVFLLAQ